MICCPETIYPFFNRLTTDIVYGNEYGRIPKVTVLYLQEGNWTPAGVLTNVQLIYSEVTHSISNNNTPVPAPVNVTRVLTVHVDHGGRATGIVKLS